LKMIQCPGASGEWPTEPLSARSITASTLIMINQLLRSLVLGGAYRRVLSLSACAFWLSQGARAWECFHGWEKSMQLSDPKPTYRSECLRCGETLFLPERSEHLDRQRIQRLWKCESCDYAFETRIAFPLHRSARTSDAD